MALLIYAFRDNNGRWHGDADVPLLNPAEEPGLGQLTYHPVPGTPETSSPFAGQTLTVLYGVVDLETGPVTYQLDTGGRFPASWHVHTLLAAPRGAALAHQDLPGTREQTPCLETAFTDNNSRYVLTGIRCDNGQLAVEVTVSGDQGEVRAELCGAVSDNDLQPLARLLDAASRALTAHAASSAVPSPRTGAPWTPEDSARLAARFRQERDFGVLSVEFGRNRGAVFDELKRQQLVCAPYQQGSAAPHQEPAPTTSPILKERRLIHRNSHARWTDEDDKQLSQRCAEGATSAELSEEFGRSKQAIEARLLKIDATGPAADEARLAIL